MTVTLCLHASGRSPRLYLFEGDKVLAAPPIDRQSGDPAAGRGIAEMAAGLLETAGRTVQDIERVVVDVGPGRLSAVRAAVSFGNALAFSRGCPTLPLTSSLAAGWQAWRSRLDAPAIVVHKSAGNTAYVGRVDEGRLTSLRHGEMSATLRVAVGDAKAVSLVGVAPETFASVLPDVDVFDGGDGDIDAETFLALTLEAPASAFVMKPVQPVTEQSDEVE